MADVWLKTNQRALILGMILPCVLIAVGLIVPIVAGLDDKPWARWLGYALAGFGIGLLALVGMQFRTPRLAYQTGELLVYLSGPAALRVPIAVVECVFLSAGAGQILGRKATKSPCEIWCCASPKKPPNITVATSKRRSANGRTATLRSTALGASR